MKKFEIKIVYKDGAELTFNSVPEHLLSEEKAKIIKEILAKDSIATVTIKAIEIPEE